MRGDVALLDRLDGDRGLCDRFVSLACGEKDSPPIARLRFEGEATTQLAVSGEPTRDDGEKADRRMPSSSSVGTTSGVRCATLGCVAVILPPKEGMSMGGAPSLSSGVEMM